MNKEDSKPPGKDTSPLTEYFEQELRRSFDAGSGFTPHIDSANIPLS